MFKELSNCCVFTPSPTPLWLKKLLIVGHIQKLETFTNIDQVCEDASIAPRFAFGSIEISYESERVVFLEP